MIFLEGTLKIKYPSGHLVVNFTSFSCKMPEKPNLNSVNVCSWNYVFLGS